MRTHLPHISPACPWCDEDHNPDIECRCQPQSTRFHLNNSDRPPSPRPKPHLITDASGKIVAVKTSTRRS